MPSGARNWLTPAAWVAAVAALLLLLFPAGFPNYDTIYSLLWGRELGEGMSPDRGAALPPTPHPLYELFGLIASPLGDGAIDLTMVIAYVSMGLIGFLVYRLGSIWFDRPIGAVAALFVLTRAPFLSNGLRAYVDLPYIALCLGALLVETRRPRAGWPVLALLIPAGLLRPEAWLFSFAYVAYLALLPATQEGDEDSGRVDQEEGNSLERADTQSAGLIRPALVRAREFLSSPRGLSLIALALAAPLTWALYDWITAGSPTYSFTGTRETVETLGRQTGPVDLVLYGPRRLGEVLQWPGMVGALGGVLLGLAFLRRRSATGVAAAVLALGAFAVLACAGLAILPRYTMLAAAVLAIFAAAGLLGWRLLDRGHPWRRAWQVFAGVVAADARRLGAQPVRPAAPGQRRPHQPGADRGRSPRPRRVGCLRAADLRADLGPQPPRGAPPRLRPQGAAEPDRQQQRAAPAATGLLPRPGEPLRRPQLHPRSQRPVPPEHPGPARLPPRGPQRVVGSLPALLEKSPMMSECPRA